MRINQIDASWYQIERTLKEHVPETFKNLGRPATERQIAILQRTIGRTLPEDLVRSLRVHNGMRDPYRLATLFDNEFLLSTAGIAKTWGMMKRLLEDGHFDAGGCSLTRTRNIRNDQWWNIGWIPITDNEGDGFIIDLDPAARGRVGQVFYFYHDCARPREVVASSYAEWLHNIAKSFAHGEFSVEEGTIWLNHR